jgi:hypothetical protein
MNSMRDQGATYIGSSWRPATSHQRVGPLPKSKKMGAGLSAHS